MYRVAICDDEIGICNQLEEYVKKYFKEHFIDVEVEVFYSGDTLCHFLIEGQLINFIFLDIELPQINGIKVGEFLRNNLKDEVTDIIYISSNTCYSMNLFKFRPLDFIIKPLYYEKIKQILDVIIKKNGIRYKYFEFQTGRIIQKIPIHQIIYLKSNNKKIHIILISGKENIFNGKLTDIEKELPASIFLKIHKSYLINYDHVEEYSYDWIKMINGDILNISKANRKIVKCNLIQHEL